MPRKLEGSHRGALKPQEITGFTEGEQSAGYKFNAYDLGVVKTIQQEYGHGVRPSRQQQDTVREAYLAFGGSSRIIEQDLRKQADPQQPDMKTKSGLECGVKDLSGEYNSAAGAGPAPALPDSAPERQPEQVSRNPGNGIGFTV